MRETESTTATKKALQSAVVVFLLVVMLLSAATGCSDKKGTKTGRTNVELPYCEGCVPKVDNPTLCPHAY